MVSGKGADSTKSTNFGLLWGSLHFGGPRSRKSSKSTGALEMASKKGADSTKSTNFVDFVGFPSISAVPEAGNPGNPQGPWKWLPEKERTLQNRQVLGFCGVPSISAVPEAGNPANPQGPWKWRPGKGADSTKSTNFGLLWGSFPPFQRSQNPEIHRGLRNGFTEKKERTLQNRQILGFCGVPSISAVPEAGNPGKSTGALEMASGKGADSTKSTSFGLLCGFLHFSGPRTRKSSKSTGALEMASGKGADSTKSTNFGLLWGSLHFGGP